MTATLQTARDEILGRVKGLVDALPIGERLVIIYDDSPEKPPTDGKISWVRVVVRHATGGQGSLSGGLNKTRWNRTGVLILEVHTPTGKGQVGSDVFCSLFRNGFEGYATLSQIWFREARIQEVGTSGAWFQSNVLVDFEYDEIK